jgi:cytochrome c553
VRPICIVVAAVIAALGAPCAMAQGSDPNLGRSLAATCANCHGTNGAAQAGMEVLAGLGKDEIVRKLQDYKTGKRPGTIMPQLAKGYTDQQIEALGAWFALRKPGQ